MSWEVLAEVKRERERQDAKWGEQNHRDGTACGESPECITRLDAERHESAVRAYCDFQHSHGVGTWRMILDEELAEAYAAADPERLREELIQVAAVAVSWVESIDRR